MSLLMGFAKWRPAARWPPQSPWPGGLQSGQFCFFFFFSLRLLQDGGQLPRQTGNDACLALNALPLAYIALPY